MKLKGFTKDGKFRPTGNRNKSSLKKEDIVHQHSEDRIGRTLPLTRKKVGSCKTCGMKFTAKDYKNASEGKESLVGDWDDQCYPCQFKERDKKSVDALGTPNDEVDHEELFNESDHDFVDYMSEGQIEDIANDYLYSLSKDMTQHDKLKALQSYLNGEFGSNPADEANLNSLANNLVFQEDLEKFEKEEHARYLEEEKFYKENNTSEAEEHEKYFKEHPDEARQKNSLGWKKMTPDERYENITRDYYIMLDNERQPVEFFDEADELASSERNMDAVVDYAMEIAEQDEPPQDLAKHIRKMKGRSDTK